VSGFCTGGNTANILVKNMGTMNIVLAEIEVIETSVGVPILPKNWTTLDGTLVITEIEPGKTGKFNATCNGYCTYRFIYGGAVGAGAQTISIAC
jgi:hypothetical protein